MKDLWKFRYSTSDVLAIEPGLTSMDIRNHRRRGLLTTDRSTEKIGRERVLSLLTVYEIVLLTVMQNHGWRMRVKRARAKAPAQGRAKRTSRVFPYPAGAFARARLTRIRQPW